ncbi:hypothetical protein GGQ64_002600 [Rhizobium azooxidifex]|uniref:Uncharacterized protein n=1 Tax=Mycoplana azooxidifex TaxID=1636188 RepID=A0A7W6D7J2_9HYPH|nr:hypothetical protein [Mycoplana azooxidifex]MBB3977394.1 hypothetical protein [Mycoplana azooxidifex]
MTGRAFNFTRRQSLGLLAAVSVPPTAVVAVAAQPTEKPFDLQHWLDTADASDVIAYHTAKLVEAMDGKDETRAYRATIDHENGFILIVGHPSKGRAGTVAKVHIDDGAPLLPDDVTSTTAFADWEARQCKA